MQTTTMNNFREHCSALRPTGWLIGLMLLIASCQNSEIPPEQAPAPEVSQGPVARLTQALLQDPDDEVSRMGLIALQGDSLPGIQKLLASDDVEVRIAGIEILEGTTAPGSIELLIASLTDPDEAVRLEVVEALGQWHNPKATDPLLALYPNESDNQVRYEILTSLGMIGDAEAIPVLQQATEDDDRYLRMWGMDALCTMRAPRATERAIKLSRDPDRFVRLQVLHSCRSLFIQNASIVRERKEVREATRMRLDGEDNLNAVLLLAEIGDPAAIPGLLQNADDPNAEIRHNIAYRLGQLGDPETIPTVIVLLRDKHDLVSGTAAGALQQWDNPSYPAVQKALQSYTGPRLPPPTGPRLPAE